MAALVPGLRNGPEWVREQLFQKTFLVDPVKALALWNFHLFCFGIWHTCWKRGKVFQANLVVDVCSHDSKIFRRITGRC